MIAPTIPEQVAALRDAADQLRAMVRAEPGAPTATTLARRAEVLDYVRARIEVFANRAAAARGEPSA